MNNIEMTKKIRKVAFIYLMQSSGKYYIGDTVNYSVQRRPQLGFQYMTAVLEKVGVKAIILDQTVLRFDLEWLTEKLKEYDIAGFYVSDLHEKIVKKFCRKIKERLNIPILVGGPGTLANSSFLDYGCDIVVHGEGEITIQEIIEYYNGERSLSDVKGIFYKKDGEVIKAPPQELIKNLDELPFPDRSKIDINSYYDYFIFGMRRPYITLVGSRGCIYRCTFCNTFKIWNLRYRRRSVDNVLSEIDDVVRKYSVKYISFQDEIFGVDNEWIKEFCKKLIDKPYKIRWMAIFHPFNVKEDTEYILRLMRKAGCDTISFGLQSAHPEILKNIHRNPAEPQRLKEMLKITNRIGFVTDVGYIFGLPGDTRATIQTTIDYSLTCGSTLAEFYNLFVFKGSEIEARYKDKKICELTEEEVKRLAAYASKRFYTKPTTLMKIAYFIVKNPGWLINIAASTPSVLTRVGLIKSKNRND